MHEGQADDRSLPVALAVDYDKGVATDAHGRHGPIKTKSEGGSGYALIFVDDYSKYVAANFITKKREVPIKFKTLMNLYENQWGE